MKHDITEHPILAILAAWNDWTLRSAIDDVLEPYPRHDRVAQGIRSALTNNPTFAAASACLAILAPIMACHREGTLTPEALSALWTTLDDNLRAEIDDAGASAQEDA